MSTKFCPHCAAKVTYEVTSPKVCPKCEKPFSAAFKTTVASTPRYEPPAAESALDAEDYDAPRSSRLSRPTTAQLKPGQRKLATYARSEPVTSPEPALGPDEEGDDDGEYIDPRQKNALRRQLIASIDPADIHVGDDDDKPVTFANWCGKPGA